MGSLFSSDSSVDDTYSTPQRVRPPERNSPSAFDPRSPTPGIVRTPLHVKETSPDPLDPRSPTAGIPRTPIVTAASQVRPAALSTEAEAAAVGELQAIIDPRSPSVGIARTPIEVLKTQPGFVVRDAVEGGCGGVPKCELDDDEEQGLDVDGRPNSAAPAASVESRDANSDPLETPPMAVPVSTAADVPPRREKPRKGSSARAMQGNASKRMPTGSIVVFADDHMTEASQPTETKSTAPAAAATASPARPASSLRSFDVNSPRHIVQQKLMQRAGILKQSAEVTDPLRHAPQAARSTLRQDQDKENRC